MAPYEMELLLVKMKVEGRMLQLFRSHACLFLYIKLFDVLLLNVWTSASFEHYYEILRVLVIFICIILTEIN